MDYPRHHRPIPIPHVAIAFTLSALCVLMVAGCAIGRPDQVDDPAASVGAPISPVAPRPTADREPTASAPPDASPSADPLRSNVISAPVTGARVPGPAVVVRGFATAFEGNLLWQVTEVASARILATGYTTAGANGDMGPFEFTVSLQPGVYTIEVWEPSMSEDGASPEPLGLMTTTVTVE